MTLTSKEHYDLIAIFERAFKGNRFDKEDKALWARGFIYQNGETNNLFKAFRHGYAYAIAEHRD